MIADFLCLKKTALLWTCAKIVHWQPIQAMNEYKNCIISLDIAPEAKQSTRFARGKSYTDPKKRAYQDALLCLIKGEQFVQGTPTFNKWAIIEITFYFTAPKKLTEKNSRVAFGQYAKTTKPDVDNLAKPVLDALTNSGIIHDDCIVYRLTLSKYWRESASIHIEIKGL